MATSYETFYNEFYDLLVGEKSFFNYKDLPKSDIEKLVENHSFHLLKKSINYIYNFGVPEVGLNSFDDTNKEITIDANMKEIDLVAEGMYYFYAREDYNKVKSLGLTFTNKELNIYSPANERKSIQDLIKDLRSDYEYNINSYLNRNRDNGRMKARSFG